VVKKSRKERLPRRALDDNVNLCNVFILDGARLTEALIRGSEIQFSAFDIASFACYKLFQEKKGEKT
jgi:hypothetical protein